MVAFRRLIFQNFIQQVIIECLLCSWHCWVLEIQRQLKLSPWRQRSNGIVGERCRYHTNIPKHVDFRMRNNWDQIPGLPTNSCMCLPPSSLSPVPYVTLPMNPSPYFNQSAELFEMGKRHSMSKVPRLFYLCMYLFIFLFCI